uniref:Uncharacterized protein n=1 Tax=Amphimedon queenslandica TaxID=400682 RepID=A0A1X7UUI7_AMPQE
MEKEDIVESESTETSEPPKKKEDTVESLAESETNEPPRKRRRLSLSSNKKNKGRFGAPVDEEQVVEASKGVVPENTKRRNQWALRNFNQWMENRNRQVPDDVIPQDILHCQDPTLMNKWLCRYVLETRLGEREPLSS